MWLEQHTLDIRISQTIINTRIRDQSIQHIYDTMQNSYKGKLYNVIKSKLVWEDFPPFLNKLSFKDASSILKIRTSNNYFPAETGRYTGLDYESRLCPFCANAVGDAYHYLLECEQFDSHRKKYLKKYFYTRPNIEKMSELLNLRSFKVLKNLSIFAKELLSAFTK